MRSKGAACQEKASAHDEIVQMNQPVRQTDQCDLGAYNISINN